MGHLTSPRPKYGDAELDWTVGAYGSDGLFQIFGFAAFLLPAAILVLGWRWLRSRAIDSQVATVVGFGLLLLSLPTLLSLWHVWDVRGAVPPGGLLGELFSSGLRTGFNLWGANLVTGALLVTALFMTTRFFIFGRARVGQWTEWPDWKSGKAGHFAEGPDALACLARRTRAAAHAAPCGGIPTISQEAGSAPIDWKRLSS